MIAFDLGVIAYTDRYLMSRPVCVDYAKTLRARINKFCEWAGADVPIYALTCDLVNEWLSELAGGGMNQWTLCGYRRAILAVWNEAYLAGDNEHAPLRLRKVKKPRLLIQAYTHVELKQILAAAAKLRILHVDDNPASYFWQAAIHVGYSCGARRGDVLDLDWSHVSPDGRLAFIQNKTGFDHTVKLSREAMKFAKRLKTTGKVLPWPYHKNWFSVQFGRIRDAAGVRRGTFKWVRRSVGSYAERENPGAGPRLLGHRDGRMFRRHYDDPEITQQNPIEPPPI